MRLALVVLSAALALTVLDGCRRRPTFVTGTETPGGEVISFSPAPITLVYGATPPDDVRAALARALSERRWILETSEGGRVVAHLEHRGASVRIAIDFGDTQLAITCLSSDGLTIESVSSSRRYDGYMRQLTGTIESEIGRPAREAAEAVARAEEAERTREREARDAVAREAERDRSARLEAERLATERERLSTERARAESDAASARAREAEAASRPRLDVGVYAAIPSLEFDARRARRARGVLDLRAGFGETLESGRGVAGGPLDASGMGLPSGCPGFFPTDAQHTVVLETDMPYFRMETPSSGDATLVVVTPDGNVWCDDDSAGNYTPRLEGWFPAGVYRVFVGSFEPGRTLTYNLLLSERRGATYVTPPVAAAPSGPDCRSTLVGLGHSPSSMSYCDGAEPRCADALLRAGHGPSGLSYCRGVEPRCAEALIRASHGPSGLSYCVGVDPTCAEALLTAGHGPSGLSYCAGVDPTCAVAVLRAGHGPSSLSSCR
jgi:hypothetical protein